VEGAKLRVLRLEIASLDETSDVFSSPNTTAILFLPQEGEIQGESR